VYFVAPVMAFWTTAVTVAVWPTFIDAGSWLPVMLRVWLYPAWQELHLLAETPKVGDRNTRKAITTVAAMINHVAGCIFNIGFLLIVVSSSLFSYRGEMGTDVFIPFCEAWFSSLRSPLGKA